MDLCQKGTKSIQYMHVVNTDTSSYIHRYPGRSHRERRKRKIIFTWRLDYSNTYNITH